MNGFWFTVESVISCLVIALFLIFLVRTFTTIPDFTDMSSAAYNSLSALDERGVLRSNAIALDFAAINSFISIPGYSHTVNICPFDSICSGPTPNGTNIYSGSYFLVGDNAYKPTEVRLYIWK